MGTRTRTLCQRLSLEVSADLWVLHPCRIWCWSSFHGFWCNLHFNLCFSACPHQAPTLNSHLISSAGREMCPANSCLISIKGRQFITGKFRVSHSAGVSKSCLQSSAVGHHLHFLSVSNKSAQFTCQNDSSNPSAKRKCPGTHLGRTNHFVFGSVIITSCNKIPGPHAARVRHVHNPFPMEGLLSWSSRHRQKVGQDMQREVHHSIASPGREDGSALQS